MTRGTMLLLLLCCLGASAVAGMSPACSAAYGGDEERYTTDVAVFQRGCAAEKRVKDPCPMACYEIVRKVDSECLKIIIGGATAAKQLDALKAACGLQADSAPTPDPVAPGAEEQEPVDNTPEPVVSAPTPTPTSGAPGGLQRPFPELCKSKFGAAGKAAYLAAVDEARSSCPMKETDPCDPACKAALQEMGFECYTASASLDGKYSEMSAAFQRPEFAACGLPYTGGLNDNKLPVPDVPGIDSAPSEDEAAISPSPPAAQPPAIAAAPVPAPQLPGVCTQALFVLGLVNSSQSLQMLVDQYSTTCPGDQIALGGLPADVTVQSLVGLAASECTPACKEWLLKLGSECFTAIYATAPGEQTFVTSLFTTCQLPMLFPAGTVLAAPTPAPAMAPAPAPEPVAAPAPAPLEVPAPAPAPSAGLAALPRALLVAALALVAALNVL